jgi:hypothetical protein
MQTREIPIGDARASAISPRMNAGSAKHANVASRAAPIPSNDDPVSSAAAIVKNRDNPSTYARAMKSPSNDHMARASPIGIKSAPIRAPASATAGPAMKTHVVVVLTTDCFRSSFAMS